MAASLHYQRNVLAPFGWELLRTLVVAAETVDTRLDQNQAVLGVLILLALLQVLANANSLSNEAVDVFGNLRSTS